jgi:hypothetical protein
MPPNYHAASKIRNSSLSPPESFTTRTFPVSPVIEAAGPNFSVPFTIKTVLIRISALHLSVMEGISAPEISSSDAALLLTPIFRGPGTFLIKYEFHNQDLRL